ncbi:Proteinase-Activated Receptor 1 [Manis pentadactyla]|nr:Proteinase-Activated Receptor 1 [Manis pentadactyla]
MNSGDRFEPFPTWGYEENSESELTEDRVSSANQGSRLQKLPAVFVSEDASGYLTSTRLAVFTPSACPGVFAASLPLNVPAPAVFVLGTQARKPAVVYMFHLAMAGVLCVSVLPFKISYYFSGSDWKCGSEVCRFVAAAFYCNVSASTTPMTVISTDRFLAVRLPALPPSSVSVSSISCCIDPLIYYFVSSEYRSQVGPAVLKENRNPKSSNHGQDIVYHLRITCFWAGGAGAANPSGPGVAPVSSELVSLLLGIPVAAVNPWVVAVPLGTPETGCTLTTVPNAGTGNVKHVKFYGFLLSPGDWAAGEPGSTHFPDRWDFLGCCPSQL